MNTARAQAQRERIIAAALQCFEAEGFHAGGMACIAAKAGVSPGLIYRYFKSKEAIIEAIVLGQLEAILADMGCRPMPDLARDLAAQYGQPRAPGPRSVSPPLVLELSAEATRSAAIAAAVRHFDTQIRRLFIEWLTAPVAEGGPGLSADVAAERALALQLVIEGLMVREVREPQLDHALLARTLKRLVGAALTS